MAATTNLSFKDGEFVFNGKQLRIFSGAIHYFRVVPEYWHDRLLKAKACGLNAVETYVPWNLHEPRPGDFKNDGILDVRKFITTAADLGLHVIFRPGPYICSEWDFGGLPSWLLADGNMKVRSNYEGYQKAVERYFSWLLPQVTDLQSSSGGPIIAVQVENEYGSFSFDPAHLLWLRDLLWRSGVTELLVTSDNETCARGMREVLDKQGTSGGENGVDLFNLPGVLPTANGMTVAEVSAVFDEIRRDRNLGGNQDSPDQPKDEVSSAASVKQSSRPLMVMELWSGWFDYWGAPLHETTTARALEETVCYAFSRGSSINLYMFHGGTNFGFLNGALQLPPEGIDASKEPGDATKEGNVDTESYPYRPDVTSYDYDAPLTEDGCVTGKYWALRKLIGQERRKVGNEVAAAEVPEVPLENNRARYPVVVEGWTEEAADLERLAWDDLLSLVTKRVVETGNPRWMESYEYPDGDVQSYGYVIYRRALECGEAASGTANKRTIEFSGRVRDNGTVLINGNPKAYVDWSLKDATLDIGSENDSTDKTSDVLDIMVENLGRVNYTTSDNQARLNTQRKGINGPVAVDDAQLLGWEVLALDFEDGFIDRAVRSNKWARVDNGEPKGDGITPGSYESLSRGPALYRGKVRISDDEPADYFIRLEGWHKGVVFVNGFNLGRYWDKGPTRSLYLPGPVLRKGENQVVVFEERSAGGQIVLGIEPRLG